MCVVTEGIPTRRTEGGIAAGDENPLPFRHRLGEVCDCREALGVDGGQREGRAPDVEFPNHPPAGFEKVIVCTVVGGDCFFSMVAWNQPINDCHEVNL